MEKKTEHNTRDTSSAMSTVATKPAVTTGGFMFNEFTYRGVDWLLNSALGVAFSYWTIRTHSGIEHFGKPVTNFFNKHLTTFSETGLSKQLNIFQSAESIKSGAYWGNVFSSIMVGGFATIPPIMALEANKKEISRSLDEMVYGKEKVANEPAFNAYYQSIGQESPKSFGIGLTTRLISLAPILGAMVAYPKPLTKYLYEPIASVTKFSAESIGIKPASLMQKRKGFEETDWDFIHTNIGTDFGLAFVYSYIHEYTYKWCSSLLDSKKGDIEKPHIKDKNHIAPQPFRVKDMTDEPIAMAVSEKPKPLGYRDEKPDSKIAQREHVAAAIKEAPSHAMGGAA